METSTAEAQAASGLTDEDISVFVDDFIGHSRGYLVPWGYHSEIVRVLRRAGIREAEWEKVRYDEAGTAGARSTMKRFLASLPPHRQAQVVTSIRDHLLAEHEARWTGPAMPGADDEVERILQKLHRMPVEIEDPSNAWPDTIRKIDKARKALKDGDPHRAIELLYPAIRSYVDMLLASHQPSIKKHNSLKISLERLFASHAAFAIPSDWSATVTSIRDGLAAALEKAHKVRSEGTDVHERGPSRPTGPSTPIPDQEAYLVAELLIVGVNYLHNSVARAGEATT